MKNKFLPFFSLVLMLSAVLATQAVAAPLLDKIQGMQEATKGVRDAAGFSATTNENTLAAILATAIKAFLSLLGAIFIILMVYAGYVWMMAHGNEEEVTKAKKTIQRAIIGLIIVVSAYAITYFIFNALGGAGSSPMGGSP